MRPGPWPPFHPLDSFLGQVPVPVRANPRRIPKNRNAVTHEIEIHDTVLITRVPRRERAPIAANRVNGWLLMGSVSLVLVRHSCADNARLVPEFRFYDRSPDSQVREKLVALLAHPAADDEQVWPEIAL